MRKMHMTFTSRRKKSKGQSLAEYGLTLALVTLFCIAALTTLGGSISDMMNGLSSTMDSISTGS